MGSCCCREEEPTMDIAPYCVSRMIPVEFYHAQVQSIFPYKGLMIYVSSNPSDELRMKSIKHQPHHRKANVFCQKPGVIEVFTETFPIDLDMIKKQIDLFLPNGGGASTNTQPEGVVP